jgi:hypothetical protein
VLGGRAQTVAQRSHAAVGRALSRPPAREQAVVDPEDDDADGVAVRLRAGVVPPQRDGQVAAGARRGRHQEVRLGEQLEVIARPRRAGHQRTTEEEEIDLLLTNGLTDPFWSSLTSPLILVECKNWKKAVGVPELRVFESKMRDRGALCRIGIFVALSGFTKPFLTRLKAIHVNGGVIFAINGENLSALVTSKRRLTSWLREEGLRRSLGGTA